MLFDAVSVNGLEGLEGHLHFFVLHSESVNASFEADGLNPVLLFFDEPVVVYILQ